jgi:N-acetylglucosaminyldiphosphoundecaprenol N-acetyl-beta-D-mannosaminyltransferase
MDLLPKLLKEAESASSSVYFYGTTNETLASIIKKAKSEFPNLKVCGSYSPPFRSLTEAEDNDIIARIKEASPDFVFVSLGCPKQEKWMASHKDKIGACLLGVGQAFKVYAGTEKRLPTWMRNLSLEWTYRLFLEPKRLWKRYLFTNSYFLLLTFNHMIFRFIAPLVKGTMTEPTLHGYNEHLGK